MSHPNPSLQAHQHPPSQSPNMAFSPPYGSPSPYLSNMPPQQQVPPMTYKFHPSFSPNTHSPINSPHLHSMSARTMSPVNGRPTNGVYAGPPPPGAMGPPSKPADRNTDFPAGPKGSTDINKLGDALTGTGVNLDEEDRNLTTANYYSQPHGSGKTHGAPGSSLRGGSFGGNVEQSASGILETDRPYETADEARRRKRVETNFTAGRWAQNPLWDAFLYGNPVEKKLNSYSYTNGVAVSKEGLYYASKDMPNPQTTEVEGHDKARQIINRGQTILSTAAGDAVGDVVKLVTVAARDRMSGILDCSGRLASERRDHSSGVVPDNWKTMATVLVASTPATQRTANSKATKTLKRTFSQVDEQLSVASPELVSVFQKVSKETTAIEAARIAKRLKRAKRSAADGIESGPASGATTPSIVSAPSAAPPSIKPPEPPKRSGRKDKKADKIQTPEEREEANKTARMAVGSTSKFAKKYGWLNASATSSPGAMSSRAGMGNANSTSLSSTPGNSRLATSAARGRRFGDWDEKQDKGMHARDVLTMLEIDGKALRTFSKGCNVLEKPERK